MCLAVIYKASLHALKKIQKIQYLERRREVFIIALPVSVIKLNKCIHDSRLVTVRMFMVLCYSPNYRYQLKKLYMVASPLRYASLRVFE